jgi:hypothetical protein
MTFAGGGAQGLVTGRSPYLLERQSRLRSRLRTYSGYPYANPTLTPAERAQIAERRSAAQRGLADNRSQLGKLKWLGPAGIALEPVRAYVQYKSNEDKMSGTENALRTGLSSLGGVLGGGMAGAACAPSMVGAVGCGAAGAYGGNKAGDWAGGAVYDVGDFTYQKGIKPLGKGVDYVGGKIGSLFD